jgi:hypothetical protein
MTDLCPQPHLKRDELIMALAQSDALIPAAQNHLEQCPSCRQEVKKLEQNLARLGELANRFTPETARPFRVPHSAAIRPPRRWLIPVLASGLTAVLVFISMYWISPPVREADRPRLVTAQELAADRALMAEVDLLVENALPEPYRVLAAISEPQTGWDEDLINWIVPSI